MSSTGTVFGSRAPLRAFTLVSGWLLFAVAVTAGGPLLAQGAPPLTLTKQGTLDLGSDGVANVGDLISYTFEVTNGDLECSIDDLAVTDPRIAAITCPSGNPIPSLGPGLSETCSASYALTQADIDEGGVYNLATAEGNLCEEVPVSDTDDHFVEIVQVSSLDFSKDGVLDEGSDGVANPGDVIDYSLTATNSGNVSLTDVTITDPALPSFQCPGGHPIATLDPGATVVCTGSFVIGQDDVDRGFRENTAEITAEEPPPPSVSAVATRTVTNQAFARVPIPQQPSVQLDKSGIPDLGADGLADPGDTIDYTLVVTNIGNVTLVGVAVTDPLIAPIICPSGNPIPSLAPGVAETCSGIYSLTAADVTAGSVPNTATASGTDPMLQPVTAADSATIALPMPMPTTGPLGLAALALALAMAGALVLRRRGRVR